MIWKSDTFQNYSSLYTRAHVKIGQFPFVCKQSTFLKKWCEMFWFLRESEKSGSRKSESKTIYDTWKIKRNRILQLRENQVLCFSVCLLKPLQKKNALSIAHKSRRFITNPVLFFRFAESTLKVYLRGAHGGCTQLSSLRRVHSVHHHRYAKC